MQSTAAFAAPASLSATSLLPASRLSCPAATPAPAVTMSLSRRAALSVGLGAIGAALLGASSPVAAKSGEGPKISIFGVGGQSSPFVAGVAQSGKVIYEPFSDEEVNYFKGIVDGSVERLASAKSAIEGKSWEDLRGALRLEMSQLRQTATTLNNNISDPKASKAASKLFAQFKKDVNDLDYAAILKNQDRAFKSYKATVKDLNSWRESVGI